MLENIENSFNVRTSTTKTMAFQGKTHITCKIAIDNETIEKVSRCVEKDKNIKLRKFQRICGVIRRTLRQKTLQSTQLKFYKVVAVPMLTYASEKWTMNRSDKRQIESAEMKFLHPAAGYTLLGQK
jgi:hypothetical protein